MEGEVVKIVSARIIPETAKRFKAKCKEEHTNMNAVLVKMIEEYLAQPSTEKTEVAEPPATEGVSP